MYFAGSDGTVDPADIATITCDGSIVQLGTGGIRPPLADGGVPPPPAASGITPEIPPIRSVTATIRYAVTTDVDQTPVSDLQLAVRYRPGGGHVVATLLEVPLYETALPGQDPGTVTEISVLTLDSVNFPPSDAFETQQVTGSGDHVVDFGAYVYYVALSLTAPDIDTAQPPAVASIGVVATS